MKRQVVCLFLFLARISPVVAGPLDLLKRLTGVKTSGADSWEPVKRILGGSAVEQGDMVKISFPRTDLNVLVDGIPLETGFALTTWFAFKPNGKETLVVGDLVLLDQETQKTLAQLQLHGLEVTAVIDPLLNESPSVKEVYFTGKGSRMDLAQALKWILRMNGMPETVAPRPTDFPNLKTPADAKASAGGSGDKSTLSGRSPQAASDWSAVEAILGKGESEGKLYQFTFPRAKAVEEEGSEIPPFMGAATNFHFQKNGKKVAVTGAFALTNAEVNPVVKVLVKNHISVTGIQNHLLKEDPRLFFAHIWAVGEAGEVATGLKAALDKVDLAPNQ
ncbi:MAG TPA: DUF1259 domain-containing protein [bacterium]